LVKSSILIPSRYIFFQVLILIFVVGIPLHFYIASELENSKYKTEQELQHYAQKVAHKIYLFSNSSAQEFYFPRSNIMQGAIYGKENRQIEDRSEMWKLSEFVLMQGVRSWRLWSLYIMQCFCVPHN